MKVISKGKIFLSDQRGLIENHTVRSYHTFKSESFQNPLKEAIGNLYLLNDEMLAPNKSVKFYTQQQGYFIIIPITGTVNYFDDRENETDVEVGESLMVFLKKNSFVKLKNPYNNDTISYLIIGIKCNDEQPNSPQLLNVDLSNENKLSAITNLSSLFKLSIGQFTGRGETSYHLNNSDMIYTFALSGAFEVDGRLLHERDGLALWETTNIEIEALSNNALLLTIELYP